METTDFGKTGLKITRLGLGLAEISRQERSKVVAEADRVLNAALDGGINFLDTAACYGRTEEIIGATVAHRRKEYILATKCGHTTDDGDRGTPWTEHESWTGPAVSESIDRSLRRLQTDHLDIVQLHSCDVDILEHGAGYRSTGSGKGCRQNPFYRLQRRQCGCPLGGRQWTVRHTSN